VTAEVDADGKLTGKVYILDANFIERPNTIFRDKVVDKLEKDVFAKLEIALGI
jgi:hypothetical protein